jgi:DNA-binding PadR family transcriptional regulator
MREQQLTTLDYALLGLLDASPMSGYDVHKIFETTPLAHFSSSPGVVYPALKRLERRGLLSSRLDRRTEARPRRVYSLRKAGESALQEWLHQQVTAEELVRNSGAPLLRFSLMGGRVSRREVIAYLRGYREVVRAYLAELDGYSEGLRGAANLHHRLSLEHGIAGYRSQLRWIDGAIEEIRAARTSGPAKEKRSRKR